jgi:hypothetical protein
LYWRQLKLVCVILGWGTSLSALTLGAVFQGLLIPQGKGILLPEVMGASPFGLGIFYAGIFAVSVLAALVISDAGNALVSCLASYGLSAVLTYIILALPGFIGAFPFPEVLIQAAIVFTFTASFPFALLLEIIGTLLGTSLSERL